MPGAPLDYAPPTEFDTGRFVARYLQALAWLSIAWMIAGPIFLHRGAIDLSPIFLFWAALALKRRSAAARNWVLAIGGISLGVIIVTLVGALIAGTSRMTVSLGTGTIKNPALWQVWAAAAPMAAVVGVPFAVLMSARARRQFSRTPSTAAADEAAAASARLSEVR